MHVTGIRRRVDLPRHVVGVIPFAPVGEDGVNGQLVRLIHRGGVAEGEKAARDDTLFPVFPLADSSVERDRDTLPREGIRPSAGQQTSREARDVTRNFAASLFRNIKYFTLRKLYLCRKWMQKRLQKTTTTGITLPNFDFLA